MGVPFNNLPPGWEANLKKRKEKRKDERKSKRDAADKEMEKLRSRAGVNKQRKRND